MDSDSRWRGLKQGERGRARKNILAAAARTLPIALMRQLPHTRSCFVCGEFNAAGLKLRFETDGRVVQTRFRPGPEHVGFRQTVHGGIIATLLDEIMVWACAVQTRRFAFCAELTVRFLNPMRPGEEVIATGELEANRKNRVFEAKAALRNLSGQTLAEATGKYLPIKTDNLAWLVTDFVGDPGWVFGLPTAAKDPP
jgi:uncharacterized protein (TIGR00369 family)